MEHVVCYVVPLNGSLKETRNFVIMFRWIYLFV
jgi:hypothetical protein